MLLYLSNTSIEVLVLLSLNTTLLYLSFNSTFNIAEESSEASILFLFKVKSTLTGFSGKIVNFFFIILFNHSTWNSTQISWDAIVFVSNSIIPLPHLISEKAPEVFK